MGKSKDKKGKDQYRKYPSFLMVEDDTSSRMLALYNLVGDNVSNRIVVGQEYVHEDGAASYAILCVDRVADAIKVVNEVRGMKQRFDVVILDGNLPDGHGRQILTAINAWKAERMGSADITGSIVIGHSSNPFAENGNILKGIHADPGKSGFEAFLRGRRPALLAKELRDEAVAAGHAAYMAELAARCKRPSGMLQGKDSPPRRSFS